MGLSIVRVKRPDEALVWGVVLEHEVALLTAKYPSHRELMTHYFQEPKAFEIKDLERVPYSKANLQSPITSDIQIFCQGLNYASHQEEGGIKAGKGLNLIFPKPPSALCGPNDTILRPSGCELLDYEIELALVLRRDLPAHTQVTTENLLDYVGGFTLANDVSARDFMFGAPMLQWFKGKGQRTFCPVGPILYLIDADELELLSELRLTLKLNEEIRQDATTDQLIFKPEETLTELASFTDVNFGDLLLTGTPGGVILNANLRVAMAILLNFSNDKKRKEKLVKSQKGIRYLQPGDKLELSLTSRDGARRFGTQVNEVRDANR